MWEWRFLSWPPMPPRNLTSTSQRTIALTIETNFRRLFRSTQIENAFFGFYRKETLYLNCSLGLGVFPTETSMHCRTGINLWRQWRFYFYVFSAVGNIQRSYRDIVVHLNITGWQRQRNSGQRLLLCTCKTKTRKKNEIKNVHLMTAWHSFIFDFIFYARRQCAIKPKTRNTRAIA